MSYLKGETPVNFQYPASKVSWNKRDALLFANSIGLQSYDENNFLYELHPNFEVFPTYPVVLPVKGTTQDVVDFYNSGTGSPLPGIPTPNLKMVLDGQRGIEFLNPLPVSSEGKDIEYRQKCIGVWDKGKPGMVIDNEAELVDAKTGTKYVRITSSAFFRGQGGWGGPKGPATINYNPPAGKKPDATAEVKTSLATAALYRLNSDYNPVRPSISPIIRRSFPNWFNLEDALKWVEWEQLHISPEVAHTAGFPNPILHGLASWNLSAAALLRVLGGSETKRFKSYQARFASVVMPGDTLVIEAWRTGKKDAEGFEDIIFRVLVKETGKVVLSNGIAKINVKEGGASKL